MVDEKNEHQNSNGDDSSPTLAKRFSQLSDQFIHIGELLAAWVFAVLFAIGVIDLVFQILPAVRAGNVTDPSVLVEFIDSGLLLLILVEIYHTIIEYVQESDTKKVVRLVIYTGVIAMVRKVIIFRTDEYVTAQEALFVSFSYTVLIIGLVALLYVERVYR